MTDPLRPIAWLCLATAAAFALFVALPEIDLGIAGAAFHDGKFLLQRTAVASIYRDIRDPISWLLLAVGFGGLLLGWWRRGVPGRVLAAQLGFVVLAFALGAGLVADAMLKQQWHRARPSDVSDFAGTQTFSPAGLISDQCDGNCSFVSGDAAFAFNLGAFGLVATGRRRRLWIGGSLLLAALVGAERVLQGAHFPSDILFAGLAVWLVMLILAPAYRWAAGPALSPGDRGWIRRRPPPAPQPAGS